MFEARRAISSLAVLAAFAACPASAETRKDLTEDTFRPAYGAYAPNGDCRGEPLVVIDQSGFSFKVGGKTEHAGSFEYAASFFGPDYEGISFAFFPFPISEYEPGHVLMYANADEVAGQLAFEDNRGPGESYSPLEDLLVKSSPLRRCAGT